MSFDIPQIHIPDNSPEAQVLEAIISREHVSPEQVVLRALREMAGNTPTPNSILAGRGLFGSPEDAAALDAAVDLAYEERRQPPKRTVSL
jgi:hypothetical protein